MTSQHGFLLLPFYYNNKALLQCADGAVRTPYERRADSQQAGHLVI
jgi:hypothetical protein